MKKNAVGTAYPGLNHGYTFDEIGNRLTSTVDAEAGGTRSTGYTSNGLNQYTAITHPSAFDVTGSAVETSVVTVNTQSAQRLGSYFRKELPASNSGQPVWANVDIQVTLPGAGVGGGDIVTNRNGHRYIAPNPESPDYDEDGNLVSDGRWVYTWDGENRLIVMETTPAAVAIGVPKRKLEFAYDGGSRRIRKLVYEWDSGTSSWTLNSERRFIYDQWNLVAEVDGSGNQLKNHVWGMDLSQTMQGAGGVGGLLWSMAHTASGSQSHFAAYDGNGNVTTLINASSGDHEAQYDYDAFGRTVLVEGEAVAESNTYRFSTKYEDTETEMYYYGFRYYSPTLGRWFTRDNLEEQGGVSLYGIVRNDAVNWIDVNGQYGWQFTDPFGKWLPGYPPPPEPPPVDTYHFWSAPNCGRGSEIRFIQAVENGAGTGLRVPFTNRFFAVLTRKQPFLDTGLVGVGDNSTKVIQEPFYPSEKGYSGGYSNFFDDKPTLDPENKTIFHLCRVCTCPNVNKQYVFMASVGPCKEWKTNSSPADLAMTPNVQPSELWKRLVKNFALSRGGNFSEKSGYISAEWRENKFP